MKILQVIPYLNPQKGGDVNVCCNISKKLAEKGHSLTIITSDYDYDENFSSELQSGGIEVIPFHCSFNMSYFFISPSMKKWLEQQMKSFDIIHLHSYRSYQNLLTCRFAKSNNIPYILQAHGSLCTFFQKKEIKKVFDYLWGFDLLADSAGFIALSTAEMMQYESMGAKTENIEIIPNGISLDKYDGLNKYESFKHQYGIESEKVILYLGRVNKGKGLDLLLKAFSLVKMNYNNVKLVIIGPDDGALNDLKTIANELAIDQDVIFTGFVSEEEKIAALLDADIFATPYYWGFPVTFIEAMACRTPIITSRNENNLEWIDNFVGYTTDYSETCFATSIEKLLLDDEVRERFASNGLQLVKQKYDWNKIVDDVEKIYSKHSISK
ncbi:glycosyltransferase [Methanogenium sp. S4BF]|uniref:glycosyltransferase n=1 Tax=Methanogenium sp. S4BF TaxID=1789226 RepID=UPI0024160022|nr:glycosyltransferase [Methanogenium sp. S4BF]WFN35333.1 glycosyltransferase [Methanogenium sp. S4BF]